MSQSLQGKVIKRDDAFEEGLPEPWLSQIWKLFKKYEVIAYGDLGPEALAELTVEDFPCIVVIDSEGTNFYEEGQKPYRKL